MFEAAWTIKGKTYVRENDKKILTTSKAEHYVEDPLGEYKGFLDGKKLRKVQGSAYNVENAYGEKNGLYVALRDRYFGKDAYNMNPPTFFLDIETAATNGFPHPEDADQEIVLIQFWDTRTEKGYVLGLEEWKYRNDYEYEFEVEYIQCDDEVQLIHRFLSLFKELNPVLIYAWNGSGFDFPYIFNRLKNLGINTDYLSNYNKASLKTKKLDNGQIIYSVDSHGHYFMDLMDVYKKFVFKNVPNYSLDTIAEIETGYNKVNHDNYIRFDDFRLGNYIITGKETEEQKDTKLYKLAKVLKENPDHPKKEQIQKYIKEKSYSDFVHYGVQDFVLLKGIHDAQNFTSIMISMASQMGCTIDDTLGTLNAWDKYITNIIYQDKLIAPPRQENDNPNVVGGYVRDPQVGKHKWILSSDVNSMYPLLGMATFNMSPETYVPLHKLPNDLREAIKPLQTQDEESILKLSTEKIKEITVLAKKYNVSLGVGGAVYRQDIDGIIPRLVTEIYLGRKKAKKEMFKYEQLAINETDPVKKKEYLAKADMLNTKQMTAKIQINSLYGALAAKYFSMFNEKIAQSITGNGRLFIQMLANNIEESLQKLIPSDKKYILYGDTDSVYFQIDNFVKKYVPNETITKQTEWCNTFYQKVIEKLVQKTIKEFGDFLNAYKPEWIGAEREVIADSGIFIAKKKYALRVRDLEGKVFNEDEPYIKIQGLEIIKGGTPDFSKKHLKEAIPVILDKTPDEIKEWFNNVKKEFTKWRLDEIARTQGVSKVSNPEWGTIKNGRKVSIPFGSRVCVVTNDYIKANNLEHQFNLIEGGDKVQVLFLTLPNPLKSEAFAFTDVRFAEMFREYIDYDTTFEKHFTMPLDLMLKSIGVDINHHTEELGVW